MTAANPEGVVRCLREAIRDAGIGPGQIDFINGHLTATGFDAAEIGNWARALERSPENFPRITATKSILGHGLGAAGAWECISTVLMLHGEFLHPCLNCEDLLESLAPFEKAVVRESTRARARVAAKASFGFGDINACVVFGKWEDE
jgi:3-oxoacyl-(acyl-carrier-protein) synthase